MNRATPSPSPLSRRRQTLTAVRDELRERRAARAARRALEHDLASYTTRREMDEVLAIVGDDNSHEAAQVRSILSRNALRHRGWMAS